MNVKYMHYLLDGCSIIVFSDEPKYHNMIAMSLAMSSTIQVFCDKTLRHNLFHNPFGRIRQGGNRADGQRQAERLPLYGVTHAF